MHAYLVRHDMQGLQRMMKRKMWEGGRKKGEKDGDTIFMDIDWGVAINLLEIFQHFLQNPGHKRRLNETSILIIK